MNLLGKITYRMEMHTPSAMEIRESERSLSYGHVWILLDVAMFRFHVYWAKVVHPDAQYWVPVYWCDPEGLVYEQSHQTVTSNRVGHA